MFTRLHQKCSNNNFRPTFSVCRYDRLDRQTQATTFIHQVFGGYLRSRGKSFAAIYVFCSLIVFAGAVSCLGSLH